VVGYSHRHMFHADLVSSQLCSIHQSVYGYRPSLGANVTFIVLFTVAMIIHTILGIRWKNWWFMWCIILGCTHEIIGYIGRVLLYNNPWSFVAFILQISKPSSNPTLLGMFVTNDNASLHHPGTCVLLCRNLCHASSNVSCFLCYMIYEL
jgi:hypothetical protein